jgi:hypothetical protein
MITMAGIVDHFARTPQNKTASILANGIRPSFRSGQGCRRNHKGVYVYPYSRNKTLIGNWRRNLKAWDNHLGNYNGFIFKLVPQDLPLIAGHWVFNREDPEECKVATLEELAKLHGSFFSARILEPSPEGFGYNWTDFEVIIPRHIDPQRIIKILRDREPKRVRERQFDRSGSGQTPDG